MMCSTAIRSSLELMLETLQQREELPEDVPPALPVRPRLPPARRRAALPIKFEKGGSISDFEENGDIEKAYSKSGFELGEIRSKRTKREAFVVESLDHKQVLAGRDDSEVSVLQIGLLGDKRERTLQGAMEIQKCFRGHQARCYFLELKRGTCTLQSFVRGETARKDYKLSIERLAAATVLQKHMKKSIARRTLRKRQKAIVCLQAATRGWLTRRHLRCTENLKEPTPPSIEITEGTRRPNCKNPENKDHIQLPSSVVSDLQRRFLRAEAAREKKEDENAALRQQIQQFEIKWSQYEAKMNSMEVTWQDQLTSLQISLVAAKRSLGPEDTDAFSTKSTGTKARDRSPVVVKPFDPSQETALQHINGEVSVVSHMVQKPEMVKSDHLASATNPDIELRKLRLRFEAWKKDYKVRLRDTTVTLQKLGLSEKEKSHKQWWKRGTQKGNNGF